MKFFYRQIFVALLLLGVLSSPSCKKDGSSNVSLLINGQHTSLQLKKASLLVSPNANTVALTGESGSSKISLFIQNNNSTVTDCIDTKDYAMTANGWLGSGFIDNGSILLRYQSVSYITQTQISGTVSVSKCDNMKVISVNCSGWLFNTTNTSDSIFLNQAAFENIQLVKH